MKNILCLFLSSFFILNVSLSQNVPDSVFNYTYEQLLASRDSVKIIKAISNHKDSIVTLKNEVIKNDSVVNINNESIINILRKEIINLNSRKEPPLISFNGFYTGITVSYQFNDSILSMYTAANGMNYDLTGSFKLSIAGLIDVAGIFGIPLRNEKFYLKASVEYKIF